MITKKVVASFTASFPEIRDQTHDSAMARTSKRADDGAQPKCRGCGRYTRDSLCDEAEAIGERDRLPVSSTLMTMRVAPQDNLTQPCSSSCRSGSEVIHTQSPNGALADVTMARIHSDQMDTKDHGRCASDINHKDRRKSPKKRKPTHTVRKEEISGLSKEMRALEARLAFLRADSFENNQPGSMDVSDGAKPQHRHIPNALLREAINEQQLSLACARSMVSQYLAADFTLPAHTYIHLSKMREERHKALMAVRAQQLRVARHYVLERSRHLNLTKPYTSSERFVNERGDAFNIRFSVVQFPGPVSVRDVYDAASFYTSNLEISFTDGAGHVTIREREDDTNDASMSQHHCLTTVSDRVLIEANLAMFNHFDEQGNYGICTSTFVDKDDLYPYHAATRIRQDVTAVLLITCEDGLVVMRRLGHVRLHHNDAMLCVDDDMLQLLSEGVSHWSDELVRHAKEKFGIQVVM